MLVVDSERRRERGGCSQLVRAHGAKAILARRPSAGLALAREHVPEVVLVAEDSDRDESALAGAQEAPGHAPRTGRGRRARRGPARRAAGGSRRVRRGARPRGRVRSCDGAGGSRDRDAEARRIAVVADDADLFDQVAGVLGSGDEIDLAWINPADAVSALRAIPMTSGSSPSTPPHDRLAFLHDLGADETLRELPLIAFVQRELSKAQRARLDALSKSAVITVADSPERLADQAALFLHRAEATLPAPTRSCCTPACRERAAPGPQGTRHRRRHPQRVRSHLDARALRDEGRLRRERPRGHRAAPPARQHRPRAARHHDARDGRLPDRARDPLDAAVRAPADHLVDRPGDERRPREGIAAGASDYISKPVDVDELVSMMRAWLDA